MFRKVAAFMVVFVVSAAAAAGAAVLDPKDHELVRDVTAVLRASPQFTIFDDVCAAVRDGVVTLTGKVTMGSKREDIGRRVAAVAGVRQVINDIDVLPASTADDRLREQVSRAIYGNASFWNYAVMPNPPIHIIVERSRVTLTGVVHTEVDRRFAQVLATQSGALSVTNNLRTDAELRAARDQAY